jgi:hypothetical protein
LFSTPDQRAQQPVVVVTGAGWFIASGVQQVASQQAAASVAERNLSSEPSP